MIKMINLKNSKIPKEFKKFSGEIYVNKEGYWIKISKKFCTKGVRFRKIPELDTNIMILLEIIKLLKNISGK